MGASVDLVIDAVGAASTRTVALAAAKPGGVCTRRPAGPGERDRHAWLTLAEITLISTYTYSTSDLARRRRTKARSAISIVEEPRHDETPAGVFATCTKAAAPPRRSSCARDTRREPVAGGRVSDIAFDAVSRAFHHNGQAFPAPTAWLPRATTESRVVAGYRPPTMFYSRAGNANLGTVGIGGARWATRPRPICVPAVRALPENGLRQHRLRPAQRACRRRHGAKGLRARVSLDSRATNRHIRINCQAACSSASRSRAATCRPDVLLMDEPFGTPDANPRRHAGRADQLSRVNPRTVLFITHSVEEAVSGGSRRRDDAPARCIREIVDVAPVRAADVMTAHQDAIF